MSSGTENKSTGSFYTPEWCVDILIDMSGFSSLPVSEKLSSRVIDPSAGDGAILSRLVCRTIDDARASGAGDDEIAEWIVDGLYGIELDETEAGKCAESIANACADKGIHVSSENVNVIRGDAFVEASPLYGTFDYVIGNPPYVRIHNLAEKPNSDYISGMCDIYYAFFDIGQRLLKPDGTLCFISPSSWRTSEAGANMRKALQEQGNVKAVLDFGHYQVFGNALTYTMITVLSSPTCKNGSVGIWEHDEATNLASEDKVVDSKRMWCAGKFYTQDVSSIKPLLEYADDGSKSNIRVRNGYATLCDKAFISKDGFPGCERFEIGVIKASRGEVHKAIYPYDEDGNLLSLDEIEEESPAAYGHLVHWKDKLLARNRVPADKWWGYGRSQSICDTYTDKVALQALLKPGKKIVTKGAPAGTGVYGGIYVMEMDERGLSEALEDEMFTQYVKALGKYKSGGYYAFSGKELERYLRWRESEKGKIDVKGRPIIERPSFPRR